MVKWRAHIVPIMTETHLMYSKGPPWAYKKPYYSGTKKHNGKTIKYVGYFDWKKVKGWLP